jgi:hypothetical membrane protein
MSGVASRTANPVPVSLLGIVGVLAVLIGAVVAAIAFEGLDGEGYSPTNHLVSELGVGALSERALIFNLGLMIGGLCQVGFMSWMGAKRGRRISRIGGVLGTIAAVAGILVGIFPLDFERDGQTALHVLFAFVFFILGWIAILIFTADFYTRPWPAFPRWLIWPGAISGLLSLWFLVTIALGPQEALTIPLERQAIWGPAALEWLALLGMLAWTGIVSVQWTFAERRNGVAASAPA